LLFHDTFTDASVRNLIDHPPDYDLHGNGWANSSGTFTTQGTYVEPDTGSSPNQNNYYADVEQHGVRVEDWFNTGGNDWVVGISFRIYAAKNFYMAVVVPVSKAFRFYHRTPTGWSLVDSFPEPSLDTGQDRKITLWCYAGGVTGQLDEGSLHGMSGYPAPNYHTFGIMSQNNAAKVHHEFAIYDDSGP